MNVPAQEAGQPHQDAAEEKQQPMRVKHDQQGMPCRRQHTHFHDDTLISLRVPALPLARRASGKGYICRLLRSRL